VSAPAPERRPLYKSSTFWIFVGLGLGVVLGGFFPQDQYPETYNAFRFCSKAFISLIKGLIVPLLFSTIVVGIAQTGDVKAVGRMGGRVLIYFEVVTTIALFIGLAVVNFFRPGDGLPIDLGSHPEVTLAKQKTGWDIALHLFPSNLIQHAAEGDILPSSWSASRIAAKMTRASSGVPK
jgi:Na+/H+-dicarboxylate symporter